MPNHADESLDAHIPNGFRPETCSVVGQSGVVAMRHRFAGDRHDLHGRYRKHKRMGVFRKREPAGA